MATPIKLTWPPRVPTTPNARPPTRTALPNPGTPLRRRSTHFVKARQPLDLATVSRGNTAPRASTLTSLETRHRAGATRRVAHLWPLRLLLTLLKTLLTTLLRAMTLEAFLHLLTIIVTSIPPPTSACTRWSVGTALGMSGTPWTEAR